MAPCSSAVWRAVAVAVALACAAATAQQPRIPSTPLTYGSFTARFGADGAFALQGGTWPTMTGTWTRTADEVTLVTSGPPECAERGRYRARLEGARVLLAVVADPCVPRRMILDRSEWRPQGEAAPRPERRILRTAPARPPALPAATPTPVRWPSFRGAEAAGVAANQDLPDTWNASTGENIRWRTPIPGLAHSSPVVWGDRVFVTTAISSRPGATFKPGLYGDGDASDDLSPHKWVVYAIDARTGAIEWERVAFEGEPRDRRHIKSTYASASPATDGRIVVAWFGSQGVHAFTVDGQPLWQVDLGRVDMGAYDIPAYEWGPASSPVIWEGLVLLQCDTQTDSFILALDAATGKTAWKTERDELPSWGTPSVLPTTGGPQLVTNGSTFVRGYDPRTGTELWRLGGSSKITAPTPVAAGELFIVASGRAPERPIFAVRRTARGDITLAKAETSSAAVAWSRTGRGPYMPTPIVYEGLLYVLANNGVFDAYDAATGQEIYRQRLPNVGSGFSASPVAADGKIHLASEDGDMLAVAAGREFRHLGTNSIGELIMATPAIAGGALYVRTAAGILAVGKPSRRAP